ncbi:23S rRNA (guanine745-N1)-methyltransferase/PadR family transcriptional regulator, regulatory protein PadR [Granulicatella balaenopterae]|uniref:23S rRNA (Guanine745-N1)-methyltransferase/PadR family transcriptional regulator, regulatory protein PadR n=1 Tax=Granulicatella balaenopterae TaxID=137733 RepID=A0A1H9JLF4_9LACT|nr:methyltransferase domain-containing protein [Granulicatella balaenopterae]SEQ87656.1 23S rRNA (guanine745-N1)-methyltransferase/PadR family transcriptional regulator, regulatory protein PadR [Granulicatella balaenopterae]
MLKKIDISRNFLQEHVHLLACPYCQSSYKEDVVRGLVCQNNHQFDLSKKGTMHLMKQPANTDYDRDLFQHRFQLAESGFFQPLLDKIAEYIRVDTDKLTVDIGCGEGSHLAYLQETYHLQHTIGLDIAKEGIILASNHFGTTNFWCLADLTTLPFAKESCQQLINILTPSHYEEFNRVLAKGGRLIKAVPNANYLIELRQQLYRSNKERQTYSNEQTVSRFLEQYPEATVDQISYKVAISPERYHDLLMMTPLYWGASEEDRIYSVEHPLTEITVDFTILVHQKD